jgi:RNA polymerase subunit RPABC4/transcription elongation factor Spt4
MATSNTLECPLCGSTSLMGSESSDPIEFIPFSAYRSCNDCDYVTPLVKNLDQANLCVVMGIERELIKPTIEEKKPEKLTKKLFRKIMIRGMIQ